MHNYPNLFKANIPNIFIDEKIKKISVPDDVVLSWGHEQYKMLKKSELEHSAKNGLIDSSQINETKITEVNKEIDKKFVEDLYSEKLSEIAYLLEHNDMNADAKKNALILRGDASIDRRFGESLNEKTTRHSIGKKIIPLAVITMASAICSVGFSDKIVSALMTIPPAVLTGFAIAETAGKSRKTKKAEQRGISVREMNFADNREKIAANKYESNGYNMENVVDWLKMSEYYMFIKLKELYHKMFQTQANFDSIKSQMKDQMK